MSKRDCENCGAKCCLTWGAHGISITDADIQKWTDNSADDILRHVSKNGWINPETGRKSMACPFLVASDGKYSCKIYPKEGEPDLRPKICATYPGNKKCLNESMDNPSDCQDGYTLNIACFTRRNQK